MGFHSGEFTDKKGNMTSTECVAPSLTLADITFALFECILLFNAKQIQGCNSLRKGIASKHRKLPSPWRYRLTSFPGFHRADAEDCGTTFCDYRRHCNAAAALVPSTLHTIRQGSSIVTLSSLLMSSRRYTCCPLLLARVMLRFQPHRRAGLGPLLESLQGHHQISTQNQS